jgi:NAD(P)-dependent dehydrogenase (short-subunit alcohol dehydrogenase family)
MDRKTAFITGAASGIGRATARRFAAEGWWIGGADIDVNGLQALRAELGPKDCEVWELDVVDKAAYDSVVAELGQRTGGSLDLLFNNAGIARVGFMDEIPIEESLKIIDVNLIGVINGIYAALPLLRQATNSLCFTTSSSAATYGAPRLAIYAATKFAVKGLTEALAVELSRYGVRAADVLPGIIDTAIWSSPRYLEGSPVGEAGVPARGGAFRLLDAAAVADAVWDAYYGDRMHLYVPEELGEVDRAKAASPEAMRDARVELLRREIGKSA